MVRRTGTTQPRGREWFWVLVGGLAWGLIACGLAVPLFRVFTQGG